VRYCFVRLLFDLLCVVGLFLFDCLVFRCFCGLLGWLEFANSVA